jgi:hypothetical protein
MARRRAFLPVVLVAFACTVARAEGPPPLRGDDVVFMGMGKPDSLRAYGATFVAWGGMVPKPRVREAHALGVRVAGAMWCLTAGARALHDRPELLEATARDIAGDRIAVPWLFDHTYQGTPSWWGCTNNPVFRTHLRDQVRKAMSSGADGLHVDDHLGVAHPTLYNGACFCDHCTRAFCAWLKAHSTPGFLAAAGVASWDGFDYRAFSRKYATNRKANLEARSKIPLYEEFCDFQLLSAAENVRQLGALAAEVAGHPVSLSANTGLPNLNMTVVTPYLTHLCGEVGQGAESGPKGLMNAVRAYRMAEALGRPMVATASGQDWDFVKDHRCENLVRLWIALSYACGQRLMTPDHVWCFSSTNGTRWYDGPTAAYAPVYQFVRKHRALFRDTRTLGPLAVPGDLPKGFETLAKRQAFQAALDRGRPAPLRAGEHVWVFPRAGADGSLIVHLLNLDYQADGDRLIPQHNLAVRLPRSLWTKEPAGATLHTYDRDPVTTAVSATADEVTITVPELASWGVVQVR